MLRQIRLEVVALALVAAFAGAGCKSDPSTPTTGKKDDAFSAGITARASSDGGATVTVRIAAKPGFHLNAEYPHHLKLDESMGLPAPRHDVGDGKRIVCKDEPEHGCALEKELELPATGEVRGVLAFSVCNPEVCLIEKVPVRAPVAK